MKNIGVGFLILSILFLIGYGFYEFMIDFSIPIPVKLSIIALVIGMVIIIGALIIEKVKEGRERGK